MDWNLTTGLITVACSIGGTALTFSFLSGRMLQKIQDSISSVTRDVADHDTKLEAHAKRFDRQEGRIVRLTVSLAKLAGALAVRLGGNPHPDALFQKIADDVERVHDRDAGETAA